MNDDLAKLVSFIDAGGLSRRGFLGRSVAFGATAVLAGSMASGLRAEEPKNGGVLKMGWGGGETTDSLDPALALNNVGFLLNRQWGDTIVGVTHDGQIRPILAEKFSANADATVWTFEMGPIYMLDPTGKSGTVRRTAA